MFCGRPTKLKRVASVKTVSPYTSPFGPLVQKFRVTSKKGPSLFLAKEKCFVRGKGL